jgi:hypothetical protein
MADNKDNTGYYNSGNYNSGNYNFGYYNSGNYNSGYYNSGNSNSGDYNSGNYNSGYYNSGNSNSGAYNSGNNNSGFFNTDEPTVRMFNKDTGKKRDEIAIPYIQLPITEWVDGKLITRTYKEAWAMAWSELTDNEKQQFLDLPNFDAKIFKEITGIDVNANDCDGKVVEIEGVKYKLSKV